MLFVESTAPGRNRPQPKQFQAGGEFFALNRLAHLSPQLNGRLLAGLFGRSAGSPNVDSACGLNFIAIKYPGNLSVAMGCSPCRKFHETSFRRDHINPQPLNARPSPNVLAQGHPPHNVQTISFQPTRPGAALLRRVSCSAFRTAPASLRRRSTTSASRPAGAAKQCSSDRGLVRDSAQKSQCDRVLETEPGVR